IIVDVVISLQKLLRNIKPVFYYFCTSDIFCLLSTLTSIQAKGSDAAATMGAEAAVYASEASVSNDLLENVLPETISDYVELVKAHLSAGPNYRFSSRQLLLLGAILDFSDATNRKAASGFVHQLLCRPIEHEIDDDGNEIIFGDGINLGGEREWSRAVSGLAKKVHASVGEFEEVIVAVIKELACPCRERSAAMMDWMHCLAVTGLLLETVDSYWCLQGKAIEPTELLHSLLLPAARQVHLDVQRVAMRCLGLFGLVERRPSEELVKQLRLSFINGQPPVRIMAGRALIDLATWHGPQELDRAIGLHTPLSNDKNRFTSVDLSNGNDDLSVGLLDLLFSALESDEWSESSEVDDLETVHGILGEGFAKILLLSQNYPSVSTCLHPLILGKLVRLYFCSEAKELERYCLLLSLLICSFLGYVIVVLVQKFVSRAFIPVMRSAWPGVYGNTGGSSVIVSKLRKRAINISRFMLQMMQTPLYSQEVEDAELSEKSPGNLSTSGQSTFDIESGEEGLAIRIGAEVASFPAKKTAAGKSYMLALCKIAAALKFRPSLQDSIKCMRGLLNHMMEAVSGDREVLKELMQMAAQLRTLGEHPDQELSVEDSSAIFAKLELDVNLKMDISAVPTPTPTPAPRSARAAAARRRARREATSSDDDEGPSAATVPVTPSVTATRMQRMSKTIAMSRMTASVAAVAAAATDSEGEGNSEVTSEGVSDESGEESSQ
ncbi:hypothetical protein Taro_039241, partial [Colocasia esculenta]|nr:hypothetical protein [Colocasia esculenta]